MTMMMMMMYLYVQIGNIAQIVILGNTATQCCFCVHYKLTHSHTRISINSSSRSGNNNNTNTTHQQPFKQNKFLCSIRICLLLSVYEYAMKKSLKTKI